MPGNERKVVEFLVEGLNKITLPHLGKVTGISSPDKNGQLIAINSVSQIDKVVTENSSKKADIFINGKGVSIKQSGSNFAFNRLQRAELLKTLSTVQINNPDILLYKLTHKIIDFQEERLESRSVKWDEIFTEKEFKMLLEFLMMKGSPNLGLSLHPADFILEAPANNITVESISVQTFDEFFNSYKSKLFIAVRRVWIGQSSDSEHKRAKSIAQKPENAEWIFSEISGRPGKSRKTQKRWRDDVAEEDRRTVYFISIEKKK